MEKVEYYTKNKKVYHYYPTEAEREELMTKKLKMLYARRKQAERDQKAYELEHSQGYCPTCFMLKPLTGICPNCN